MTKHTIVGSLVLCLFGVLSGCSKVPPKPTGESANAAPTLAEDKRVTSVDVVKVTPQPAQIAPPGSSDATIKVTIQGGYHINANPPTYPYLIATSLQIAGADGISAGVVTYPKPVNKLFAFAEKALAVYEGEVEVKARLRTDESAKPGPHTVAGKLRIQACDELVCYPPGTLDLTIPVTVK